MATQKRNSYDVFTEAIAAGIKPTVHDCWADFSCWERARNYVDDPSHPAKAAVEWIYMMEDMRGGLSEFEGEATSACLAALDEAYLAFAKLEHSPELVHAIETWKQYRLDEKTSE